MTQILTANIGSYPRIGETKDQQRLRRAYTHLSEGDISRHAFGDVEQSVIQELVREQLMAGLDEITDGLVTWTDPITHFVSHLDGFEFRAFHRYFDNNFFYRTPIIRFRPKRKKPVYLPDYLHARGISHKPVRQVMTGPYTLARLSESSLRSFSKLPARVELFTALLGEEITQLLTHGATLIQVDEPAILSHPEDFGLLHQALSTFAPLVKPAEFILALYFGPISPLYERLNTLPVDALNLDFTSDGRKLFQKILNNPPTMRMGFGLINGRNTRMEAIDPIVKMLRLWREKHHPPTSHLTPSCGLEYLPRDYAFSKLRLLSKIQSEYHGWVQGIPPHAHN